MSEPLAERLSRFTPDAAGLDRDALLFAAGRASARPNRRWQLLAGVLAACQLATLVALWPTAVPTGGTPVPPAVAEVGPASRRSIPSEPVLPPTPHDPAELGVLSQRILASEGDWIPPGDDGPTVASEPPLHAFGPPPAKYLN